MYNLSEYIILSRAAHILTEVTNLVSANSKLEYSDAKEIKDNLETLLTSVYSGVIIKWYMVVKNTSSLDRDYVPIALVTIPAHSVSGITDMEIERFGNDIVIPMFIGGTDVHLVNTVFNTEDISMTHSITDFLILTRELMGCETKTKFAERMSFLVEEGVIDKMHRTIAEYHKNVGFKLAKLDSIFGSVSSNRVEESSLNMEVGVDRFISEKFVVNEYPEEVIESQPIDPSLFMPLIVSAVDGDSDSFVISNNSYDYSQNRISTKIQSVQTSEIGNISDSISQKIIVKVPEACKYVIIDISSCVYTGEGYLYARKQPDSYNTAFLNLNQLALFEGDCDDKELEEIIKESESEQENRERVNISSGTIKEIIDTMGINIADVNSKLDFGSDSTFESSVQVLVDHNIQLEEIHLYVKCINVVAESLETEGISSKIIPIIIEDYLLPIISEKDATCDYTMYAFVLEGVMSTIYNKYGKGDVGITESIKKLMNKYSSAVSHEDPKMAHIHKLMRNVIKVLFGWGIDTADMSFETMEYSPMMGMFAMESADSIARKEGMSIQEIAAKIKELNGGVDPYKQQGGFLRALATVALMPLNVVRTFIMYHIYTIKLINHNEKTEIATQKKFEKRYIQDRNIIFDTFMGCMAELIMLSVPYWIFNTTIFLLKKQKEFDILTKIFDNLMASMEDLDKRIKATRKKAKLSKSESEALAVLIEQQVYYNKLVNEISFRLPALAERMRVKNETNQKYGEVVDPNTRIYHLDGITSTEASMADFKTILEKSREYGVNVRRDILPNLRKLMGLPREIIKGVYELMVTILNTIEDIEKHQTENFQDRLMDDKMTIISEKFFKLLSNMVFVGLAGVIAGMTFSILFPFIAILLLKVNKDYRIRSLEIIEQRLEGMIIRVDKKLEFANQEYQKKDVNELLKERDLYYTALEKLIIIKKEIYGKGRKVSTYKLTERED